jgi:hypothetical protein
MPLRQSKASTFLDEFKLRMEGRPGQLGLGIIVTRNMAIDALQTWKHETFTCPKLQKRVAGHVHVAAHVRNEPADHFVDDSEEWLEANGLGLQQAKKAKK